MNNCTRKKLKSCLILLVVLCLGSCGSRVNSIADTVTYAVFGAPDVELTESQIKELKFAAQYVKLQGQARTLVILAFADDSQLQWVTGSSEILLTQNGRMIGMRNVDKPNDQIEASIHRVINLSPDPLVCLVKRVPTNNYENCGKKWQAEVLTAPGVNQQRFLVSSELHILGTELIQMPAGYQAKTLHLRENVKSSSMGEEWQFDNQFWLEINSGRIIKSSQQYIPLFPRVDWQELKAYAKKTSEREE